MQNKKSTQKNKSTSVISIRLPEIVATRYKVISGKQGISLNRYLSSILVKNHNDDFKKSLKKEEIEFIDKILFWDWLIDNMGRENVENMMILTKHLSNNK